MPSLVVIGGDEKPVQSPAEADLTVMNRKQTQRREDPVAARPAALQLRMQWSFNQECSFQYLTDPGKEQPEHQGLDEHGEINCPSHLGTPFFCYSAMLLFCYPHY